MHEIILPCYILYALGAVCIPIGLTWTWVFDNGSLDTPFAEYFRAVLVTAVWPASLVAFGGYLAGSYIWRRTRWYKLEQRRLVHG